jgi:hypothetical protein
LSTKTSSFSKNEASIIGHQSDIFVVGQQPSMKINGVEDSNILSVVLSQP